MINVIKWKHFPRYCFFFCFFFCGGGGGGGGGGDSPVTSEFPAQTAVTRSFDIFLNLRLNKRLSKH